MRRSGGRDSGPSASSSDGGPVDTKAETAADPAVIIRELKARIVELEAALEAVMEAERED